MEAKLRWIAEKRRVAEMERQIRQMQERMREREETIGGPQKVELVLMQRQALEENLRVLTEEVE
jgi:TolA-binding protein